MTTLESRPTPKPGFACVRNRGFSITFANRYTVSVQFGENHYCSQRNTTTSWEEWRRTSDSHQSPDAEVAILDPQGNFVPFESSGDQVRGRTDSDTVAKIIEWVSTKDTTTP